MIAKSTNVRNPLRLADMIRKTGPVERLLRIPGLIIDSAGSHVNYMVSHASKAFSPDMNGLFKDISERDIMSDLSKKD